MLTLTLKLTGAAILALAASLVVGSLALYESLLAPLGQGASSGPIEVKRGVRLADVARELEQRGLLSDARALQAYGRLTGKASAIKAGSYALVPGDTALSALNKLVRGDTIQYALTLVEGWTFRQIRAALIANQNLTKVLVGLSDAEVMQRIGRDGEHPEGRFFPDTYHFSNGHTDADVLERAYQIMSRKLAAAWVKRAPDLPYESPYEALIMASIVERESAVRHERHDVAGVFVRRLKRDMLLQTDPTVIYGMGERYDGNIRRKDLREDTPYNTYVHKGLTPTPIANPGDGAIHAALNPAPGTSLYFVAKGDGTGEHVFSDSYQDHKRAVAAYLTRLRKNRKSKKSSGS
jgi:UPF0755 protein